VVLVLTPACSAELADLEAASQPGDLPQASTPAFPGAEGAGAFTPGGRGGKVYVVTTLEDYDPNSQKPIPGSLRAAAGAEGKRIIVFGVSGWITLKTILDIDHPFITIAGQTAPGEGVGIRGETTHVNTHDVVIRYMRFRRGLAPREALNPRGDYDALGGRNCIGNTIYDHVSASWGMDETISIYRHMYQPKDGSKEKKLPTVNLTIQWTIISEALNPNNHAFGATWGGRNTSFHHNLFACNTGRNPSIGMGFDFNFVNNVVFNWQHRTADGGDDSSRGNFINNYYKPGPATRAGAIRYRIVRPDGKRVPKGVVQTPEMFGKWYVVGNVVEGNERVTADNWAGGVQFYGDPNQEQIERNIAACRVNQPLPMAPLTIHSAQEAFERVLEGAGASLPRRDAVDQRIVKEVRTGKVTFGNGIITDPSQVGGWPVLKPAPAPVDADADGMPDAWEKAHGLNPNDASDSSGDKDNDGYTNVEEYLNGTDPGAFVDYKNPANNVNTLKPAK
jgi:hypothetical protein